MAAAESRPPPAPPLAPLGGTVTRIEVHRIADVGFAPAAEAALRSVYGSRGLTQRTVYVAHTDTGLIGLGEGHGDSQELAPGEYVVKYRSLSKRARKQLESYYL
jgi:hypothetical protein